MPKGFKPSLIIHGILLALVIFGLPSLFYTKREVVPSAIVVEILPIADQTNAPSAPSRPKPKTQQQKPKPKPEPKKEKKPEPKPEPKKPEPKPEPKKDVVVAPKPEPKVKPKPPEPKKEEKKEEPKKEEPKKEKPEKPKKPEKSEEDIMKDILSGEMLRDLAKDEAKKNPDKKDDTGKAQGSTYNPSLPLSVTQKDDIARQVERCWNVAAVAGLPGVYEMVAILDLEMGVDGTVRNVSLNDSKLRYGTDSNYRAFTESAMRAVRSCSPLQRLRPDQYDRWKNIRMPFSLPTTR